MTAFVISNAGGNWNAAASYVANSGFPVAGDTVTATGTSGNLTVNVASACASIILTNYVGTLTFDSTLTLTSTCTLVSGMTVAGTAGTLICTGNATLTSGGKTLTCALTIGQNAGTATFTLSGNWTVNGLVTLGPTAAASVIINSGTIFCGAGLTIVGTAGNVSGTTVLNLSGTGTFQQSSTASTGSPITFAAGGGTITISGTVRVAGNTVTYTSGTMVTAGSTLLCVAGTTTLNTNGMTWNIVNTAGNLSLSSALQTTDFTATATSVSIFGANPITTTTMTTSSVGATTMVLTADITVSGLWTASSVTSTTWSGGDIFAGSCTISNTQTMTLTRDAFITGLTTISDATVINGAFNWRTYGLTTTGALTGTSTILFNGTGTWTGGAGASSMSTTINTAGTLTLSGTILYAASGTPTLTYTAGTISAGTSILSIASSCTLATSGMTWANVTLTAAQTLTLSSLLNVSGTLTYPNAAVTTAGAGDWTTGTFTTAAISAARVYTMDSGNTYTINTAYTVTGLTAGHVSFVGSAASGTKANIVLAGGASQSLLFVDATDIDSSAGQPIYSLGGTLLRTVNWNTSIAAIGSLRAIGSSG